MLYCTLYCMAVGVNNSVKEKRMRSRLERMGRERTAGKEWTPGKGRGVG